MVNHWRIESRGERGPKRPGLACGGTSNTDCWSGGVGTNVGSAALLALASCTFRMNNIAPTYVATLPRTTRADEREAAAALAEVVGHRQQQHLAYVTSATSAA